MYGVEGYRPTHKRAHLRGEDIGEISGALQNPQDQRAVLKGLEKDDVVAMRATPKLRAEFRASDVMQRPLCDLLAVLTNFTDEGERTPGIVERDVVADLFEVGFGLWREIGEHLLFLLLGGFHVFALKAVENLCSRLGLPAFPAFIDLTAQSIERCLSALLFLFQETQSITQDFARAGVTASIDLFLHELLEVFAEGIA